MEKDSQILLYQTEDGHTKIDVRLEEETVWLNQKQIVELFHTTKQNISLHINNIFKEGELDEISVVKDYLTTADDFLLISEKEILNSSGKISHTEAVDKAIKEYEKYRQEESIKYISDFDREMKKLLKNEKQGNS